MSCCQGPTDGKVPAVTILIVLSLVLSIVTMMYLTVSQALDNVEQCQAYASEDLVSGRSSDNHTH